MLTVRYCSECREERPFERPPCLDDHGSDCPEEICTGCGCAVVVGEMLPEVVLLRSHAA